MRTMLKGAMFLLFIMMSMSASLNAFAGEQESGTQQTEEIAKPEKADGKDHKKRSWWAEHIDLYGDFRLRYEMIKEGGKGYRNRARLRARVGLTADVLKTLDLGIRIATGSGDPVSTNVTLGDGFSKKFLHLDLAYFDWHPCAELHVKGGKIVNPFYRPVKSELVWDADLTPEGLGIQYERALGPVVLTANTGGFWVNESSGDDTWLLGAQGLVRYNIKEKHMLYVLTGASYYYYTDLRGKPTLYDQSKSYGNSVDANGNYQDNFRELEAILEIGGRKWDMPMAIFGQYIINLATSTDRQGWMAGFYIGDRAKPFRPAFRYDYRWIQSDAAVGLFTDSDFNGHSTDGKGHEFNLDIPVHKQIFFEITYFLNTHGLAGGTRYQRVMADFNVQF